MKRVKGGDSVEAIKALWMEGYKSGWADVTALRAALEKKTTVITELLTARANLTMRVHALEEAMRGGHRKLATYQHVYKDDKELRRLLTEWDSLIAKEEGK